MRPLALMALLVVFGVLPETGFASWAVPDRDPAVGADVVGDLYRRFNAQNQPVLEWNQFSGIARRMEYDAEGNLTKEEVLVGAQPQTDGDQLTGLDLSGATVVHSTMFAYDAGGRRTITKPMHQELEFVREPNRKILIRRNGQDFLRIQRTSGNLIVAVEFLATNPQIHVTFRYDGRRQLAAVRVNRMLGPNQFQLVAEWDMDHDPEGRLTQVLAEHLGLQALMEYQPGTGYLLREQWGPTPNPGVAPFTHEARYGYDMAGNRTLAVVGPEARICRYDSGVKGHLNGASRGRVMRSHSGHRPLP